MDIPRRPVPAEQGEKIEIDGRSGFLWKSKKRALLPVTVSVECSTTDGWTADEITEWLHGEGLLRFSDDPDRVYRARVHEEFTRESMFFGFDRQMFTVPFDCQPHRYFYPATVDEMTTFSVINNPGTASSRPRITVEGGSDGETMVVYIGDDTIEIVGSGLIVDSEMMECFELDGATLATHRVIMSDYPEIPPGGITVSWSGDVQKITIEGRWRSR
jgi:predicted phage tail component-like protein